MHCIQSFLTSKRQLGKLQCFPKELFQWLFFLCFHPVGRDTWQGSTVPPGCWALGLFCCLTLARQTAQREAGVGTVGKGSSMEGVSVTSAGLGLRSSSFSVSWLWSSFTASPLCRKRFRERKKQRSQTSFLLLLITALNMQLTSMF